MAFRPAPGDKIGGAIMSAGVRTWPCYGFFKGGYLTVNSTLLTLSENIQKSRKFSRKAFSCLTDFKIYTYWSV
jgi:hypothetical protein